MIEELTPRLLSVLVLLVVTTAPVLTLLLSAMLLRRYRRTVTEQMALTGGFDGPATDLPIPDRPSCGSNRAERAEGAARYRRAVYGPRQEALRYIGAGLAFALVFALAARFVYPFRLGLPGFLISVWIYAWPVIPALMLIVPASMRGRLAYVAAYFAVFTLLALWAGTVADIPATRFGAITLPARSSATPELTAKLWLVVNGVPTLLILLCFNRWVRAVAPIVLGFVTTALTGTLVTYIALFSVRGADLAVALSVSLNLHVGWIVLGTILLSLAGCAAIGWVLARWIARAYRLRKVSDQSLVLDALWLLFASYYAMWLILGGLVWTATALVAFAVHQIALALARKSTVRAPQASCGLTFLRVFSLGRRSERLFDTVTKYWRHIGSVQMITGPDVARSTVQPHQFLDFLSGRLPMHFVRDAASLARSVSEWDRHPGVDGRFRLNNFFCHADSWQRALLRLVEKDDVVLMDLRSFSATNAGCIHELQHLVGNVPLDHCLLIVDDTTDVPFLERTLQQAWQGLPPNSPNQGRSPNDAPLHRFGAGAAALRPLLRRLCDAGTVGPTADPMTVGGNAAEA